MEEFLFELENKKYFKPAVGAGIFLLVLVLAIVSLVNSRHNSHSALRLSSVSMLRSDLALYYRSNGVFPMGVKYVKPEDEEECRDHLCVDRYPVAADEGIISYTPCQNRAPGSCAPGTEDAQSYVIRYSLTDNVGRLSRGEHYATPWAICADCRQ